MRKFAVPKITASAYVSLLLSISVGEAKEKAFDAYIMTFSFPESSSCDKTAPTPSHTHRFAKQSLWLRLDTLKLEQSITIVLIAEKPVRMY